MRRPSDGGPAFPRPHSEHIRDGAGHPGLVADGAHAGMTLLEYFAGQAMLGFIASGSTGDIATASVVEAYNLMAALSRSTDDGDSVGEVRREADE